MAVLTKCVMSRRSLSLLFVLLPGLSCLCMVLPHAGLLLVRGIDCYITNKSYFFRLQSSNPPSKSQWKNLLFGIGRDDSTSVSRNPYAQLFHTSVALFKREINFLTFCAKCRCSNQSIIF